MYTSRGFDSKLKLILNLFPVTLWSIQNLDKNATGNQCTVANINT